MKLSRTLLVAVLVVSACDRNPAELVPDTKPNVAAAYINGLQVRRPENGRILVPAAQMYDPNTGNLVSGNPVPVEITASDEREIVELTAILKQGSADAFGDIVYTETWRKTLTQIEDSEVFRNPFGFDVPFEGDTVGLVPAALEVIAKDNAGQTNEPYSVDVLVDGSLALLNATVPETSQSGEFGLAGFATDPESGIREFAAFIDGTEVPISEQETDSSTSFAIKVSAEALGNGPHFLTLFAVNGVNEAVAQQFTFTVLNNAPPEAGDDEATTEVGTSVTIDVLANDKDEDGDPLTITTVTAPNNGTAQINGGALIVYTPDAGFVGTDTFFYTVKDVNGGVNSAQVFVQVGAAPAP